MEQKELTASENLFIRACKSGWMDDRVKRIQSVYKRFYLMTEAEPIHIVHILMDISEKIGQPVNPRDLLEKMNPISAYYSEERSYWENAMYYMVSHIALTEVAKIEGGFKKALRWRLKEQEAA